MNRACGYFQPEKDAIQAVILQSKENRMLGPIVAAFSAETDALREAVTSHHVTLPSVSNWWGLIVMNFLISISKYLEKNIFHSVDSS